MGERIQLSWAIDRLKTIGWDLIERRQNTCCFRLPDSSEPRVRVHCVGEQFGDDPHWFAIRPDTFQNTMFHVFLSQSQNYALMIPNALLIHIRRNLFAPIDLIGERNKKSRWSIRLSFGRGYDAAILRPDNSDVEVDVTKHRIELG